MERCKIGAETRSAPRGLARRAAVVTGGKTIDVPRVRTVPAVFAQAVLYPWNVGSAELRTFH